jgi:thioredoxin reductase (NADPH)
MTDFEIKDDVIYCHSNDNVIKTRNIIIATGNGIFSPNLLEIPGSLNHPDVEYIVRPYSHYGNKEVVILGGGDSAVD